MVNILLFGNRNNSTELGQFSKSIYEVGNAIEGVRVITKTSLAIPDIVIYSNRTDQQLLKAINTCNNLKIPLIVLSTDIQDSINKIKTYVEIFYLPNSSVRTIAFINKVEAFYKNSKDWVVEDFSEWHQESKNNISGTAVYLAKLINFDPSKITKIRDDKKAHKLYSIPKTENAFAIHTIKFVNKNSKEKIFTITTVGREEYAKGAINFAISKVLNNK